MKFLIHFLIGTVAASSIIAFNFTGFNVFPYFLKNMTLTETLSSSYSATPSITPLLENFTVRPFENSTAILNSTNVTIAPPLLNITNTTRRPLNATNPPTNARRTQLNTRRISLNTTNSARRTPSNATNSPTNTPSLNATNPSTKPPRHSYLRYSRRPTKSRNSTPSRTSKYW
jgi:hypothetical protein